MTIMIIDYAEVNLEMSYIIVILYIRAFSGQ